MDSCIQLCEIKVVVKYKTYEEGPWTALILKEKERRCGKQIDFFKVSEGHKPITVNWGKSSENRNHFYFQVANRKMPLPPCWVICTDFPASHFF